MLVLSEILDFFNSGKKKSENYILQKARFHHKAQSVIKSLIAEAYNVVKHHKDEKVGIEFKTLPFDRVSKLFLFLEELNLLQELKSSNKSAIILPRYASLEYAVILSNQSKSKDTTNALRVQIGKEKIF